jgi:aspartate/methionine/tyrosine aminotransferase
MDDLPPFALERFCAKHEFTARYLLCCSDPEPMAMQELLDMASNEEKTMWNNLKLGYTETQGLPVLREEISRSYAYVDKQQITIGAPQELIFLALNALLLPTSHVVCMVPAYQSLYSIAIAKGAKVSFWEPRTENGSLVFDVKDAIEMLEQASTTDTPIDCVVVNFPHNPTGFIPTREEWDRLIHACDSYKCGLFSDEMYRGLELSPERRLPAACDSYPSRGVSLSGVSKSLALPGLRIGHIATSKLPGLHSKILEMKDYTTICSSAPSEILALIAWRNKATIIERNCSIIRSNIEILDAFFKRHVDKFDWTPPLAGSTAFPRLKTGEPIDMFCDRVVQGCGVLLLPSTVYGHAPDQAEEDRGRFRIGLGRSNLKECIENLETFLTKSSSISAGTSETNLPAARRKIGMKGKVVVSEPKKLSFIQSFFN